MVLTGPLQAELLRCGVWLHVFVGEENVTKRCYYANDCPGSMRADLYRLDADGNPYVDPLTGELATEHVFSGVVIREDEPLRWRPES